MSDLRKSSQEQASREPRKYEPAECGATTKNTAMYSISSLNVTIGGSGSDFSTKLGQDVTIDFNNKGGQIVNY